MALDVGGADPGLPALPRVVATIRLRRPLLLAVPVPGLLLQWSAWFIA